MSQIGSSPQVGVNTIIFETTPSVYGINPATPPFIKTKRTIEEYVHIEKIYIHVDIQQQLQDV